MLKPTRVIQISERTVTIPDNTSSPTIMVRRLMRSASTPPKGPMMIVGMTETASTVAKAVGEPVASSTHIDMANRSMVLPNSEMP